MTVLHFRRMFSGLTETFLYDLIVEVDRQSPGQHVATFDRVNETGRPFPRLHELHEPARFDPRGLLERVASRASSSPATASWPFLRKQLRQMVAQLRPDLIHAHFGPEGVLIAPVARDLGIPLVTSFYGFDASHLLEQVKWRALIHELVLPHDVVVLSRAMQRRLISVGAAEERTHVVHLGKRLDEYEFQPSVRVRRLLSVGRMTAKKGHLDTVRAFASIIPGFPDAHLDIVGDGLLYGRVAALVDELGMDSHVTLHGALPHDHVRRLFESADAFVLCSRTAPNGDREGTPTVLLEAQAAGLPCIATFHAGIPETIPERNHDLLAEEGVVEDIADRMARVLRASSDELRERGVRGRRHVEREFDIENVAAALLRVYQKGVATRD